MGTYIELCFTTGTAKVALSEQQHRLLDDKRVATMRVYVSAVSKRAVVVEEDDLLAKAEMQANPVQVSKALSTELKRGLTTDALRCRTSLRHKTS